MSCLILITLLSNSSWDISTGMWLISPPRWTRIRLMACSEYEERNLSIRCPFPTWVLCLVQHYSEHRQKKEGWTWSIWVFNAKYVGDQYNVCSGHWRGRFSKAIETILDKYHEIFVEEEDDGEQQSWSLPDWKACFGLKSKRHSRTGLNAIERNTLFFRYPLWSVRLVLVMLVRSRISVFKVLSIPCLIDQSSCRHAPCALQRFVFMPLVPTLKMLKTKLKSKILSKAWEKRGKCRPRSAHSTGRPTVFCKNQKLCDQKMGKLTQSSERKRRVSRQRLVPINLPKYGLSHPLCSRSYPTHQSHIPQSVLALSKLNSLGQRDRKAFLNCWQGANSSPLALTHLW